MSVMPLAKMLADSRGPEDAQERAEARRGHRSAPRWRPRSTTKREPAPVQISFKCPRCGQAHHVNDCDRGDRVDPAGDPSLN